MRQLTTATRLADALEGSTPMPDDLAEFVAAASLVSDFAARPGPDPDFRARLRADLLAAAEAPVADREVASTRPHGRRWSEPARAGLATAVAAGLIATTGVVAAAQHALPGDPLHPVKTAIEQGRLSLSADPQTRGRLHLAIAEVRLGEVEDGVHRLSPDELRRGLEAVERETATGAELLFSDLTPQAFGLVREFTATTRQRLLRVEPMLPLTVRHSSSRAMEVLRRIDEQLDGRADAATCRICRPSLHSAGEGVTPAPGLVPPDDASARLPDCQCPPPAPPVGGDDASNPDEPTAPATPTPVPDLEGPDDDRSTGRGIDSSVEELDDAADVVVTDADSLVDELLRLPSDLEQGRILP